MSRAEERTSSEPRRQDGGYGGERASRSFYSPAPLSCPPQPSGDRDRSRLAIAHAVVRFAPFCYVVSATAPLARSTLPQCSPSWKSKSPSPPSCNRRHRRDGVIFRRARTHSLTFSARSLGRSIGRSHFGSIAALPCLRITRVRVSQDARRHQCISRDHVFVTSGVRTRRGRRGLNQYHHIAGFPGYVSASRSPCGP